jgi:hypothetical protein
MFAGTWKHVLFNNYVFEGLGGGYLETCTCAFTFETECVLELRQHEKPAWEAIEISLNRERGEPRERCLWPSRELEM